jgi:hypothetical protein
MLAAEKRTSGHYRCLASPQVQAAGSGLSDFQQFNVGAA